MFSPPALVTRVSVSQSQLCLPLPYHEYVLGLADLTGELMRRCISSVSSGQLDECWRLCGLLRTIHEGFVNIGQWPRCGDGT